MSTAPPPYTEHPHHGGVHVYTQQPVGQGTQTVVLQTIRVGPGPSLMTCPNCRATITTSIDYQISGRTHLCALGLCLIGFWPCIPIPYLCCGGCCQRTVHSCPNCNHFIGSF